ncbi:MULTISPECIES: cytochrome P450 [unclassified Microbulbifer]|uniref:cytochrome P450 n=1 Tax=unclassified Microbulbifer TaxID=2619833 RepID=UPI0027E4586F|nr:MULTISPECIES: cytochrome P450 [unclassified Microbulbifer]
MDSFLLIAVFAVLLSLPYWLPPLVIRLRMNIFTRINGEEAIQLPGNGFDAEDFKALYAHPAMKGRSKGAALSDLFWYWLSPGPEMHPEHLEQSERYRQLAGFSHKIMAISRKDIESLIDQYRNDPLKLGLGPKNKWTHIRLRDAFMSLWADFFYQVVFKEKCDDKTRKLIVNHARDVVNALKCVKLRNMSRRKQLTNFLLEKLSLGEFPHTFPDGLTHLEQAHYLQGTFFNTAIVQMSEAMAHLTLVVAQHPDCQERLCDNPDNHYLDDVINESLRLHPLFGIAHRIATETVEFKGKTIPKHTVVCFNYPEYHKLGYDQPTRFDPERWGKCPIKESNFIPFGVTANRSCPAQGLAMVSMRQLTKHLFRNYRFSSPIVHTRSLPNRGPCLVFSNQNTENRRLVECIVCPLMKIRDRWEDLFRSIMQLFFGTAMILHAKKLRLCDRYFEKLEKRAFSSIQPSS